MTEVEILRQQIVELRRELEECDRVIEDLRLDNVALTTCLEKIQKRSMECLESMEEA